MSCYRLYSSIAMARRYVNLEGLRRFGSVNYSVFSCRNQLVEKYTTGKSSNLSLFKGSLESNAIYARSFSAGSWFSKSADSSSPGHSDNDKGELVYVGTMSRLVRIVKLFSLSTSVAGVAIQPAIYNQVADLHWALALSVGGVASFFVFITPLLLHLVTKRYVTEMYWNSETGQFTATTYSFLLKELKHTFEAKQVTLPNTAHLFTTVLIDNGKRPLFIDPSLFLDRRALVHLLKYNEPLEWEIPPQEGPSSYWEDSDKTTTTSSKELGEESTEKIKAKSTQK